MIKRNIFFYTGYNSENVEEGAHRSSVSCEDKTSGTQLFQIICLRAVEKAVIS